MQRWPAISLDPPLTLGDLAVSALAGGLAFPSALGLAQLGLFRPLRATCSQSGGRHSRVLASLLGGVSVCAAGCAATLAAVGATALVQSRRALDEPSRRRLPRPPRPGADTATDGVSFGAPEVLLSTLCGAVVFRALGGRFSSVLPSSLTRPGAFAREGIPARGVQYATDSQRVFIQQLGRKHGCHSCGRRGSSVKFVADHQPPSKLVEKSGQVGTIAQRFFPQCGRCANRQGGILASKAGKTVSKLSIVVHPFALRLYHLFLPVPFGVAFVKSQYSSGKEDSTEPVLLVRQDQAVAAADKNCETASSRSPLKGIFADSNLTNLVTDFPLLIIWNRIVGFLDSFDNPGDAFHLTLWFFVTVAALGTI